VDYDQLKNYYIERKIGDAVAYLPASHAKDIPVIVEYKPISLAID